MSNQKHDKSNKWATQQIQWMGDQMNCVIEQMCKPKNEQTYKWVIKNVQQMSN